MPCHHHAQCVTGLVHVHDDDARRHAAVQTAAPYSALPSIDGDDKYVPAQQCCRHALQATRTQMRRQMRPATMRSP